LFAKTLRGDIVSANGAAKALAQLAASYLHKERSMSTAANPSTNARGAQWDRIAGSQQFKDLMATKKIFIVPAFVFFVVYYFALPILVGYAPHFMAIKVAGNVNIAYLFALSQFIVAWIIAGLYVKAANDFDRLSRDIIEEHENSAGGK
jgi:uncharacterized membrane protein (DUF485 family)